MSQKGLRRRAERGLPTSPDGKLTFEGGELLTALENRQAFSTPYREEVIIDAPGRGASGLERAAESALNRFTGRRPTRVDNPGDAMRAALNDYDQRLERAQGNVVQRARPQGQYGFLGLKFGGTVAEAQDNAMKLMVARWRLKEGDTLDEAAEVVRDSVFNYLGVGRTVQQAGSIFPFSAVAGGERAGASPVVDLQPGQAGHVGGRVAPAAGDA